MASSSAGADAWRFGGLFGNASADADAHTGCSSAGRAPPLRTNSAATRPHRNWDVPTPASRGDSRWLAPGGSRARNPPDLVLRGRAQRVSRWRTVFPRPRTGGSASASRVRVRWRTVFPRPRIGGSASASRVRVRWRTVFPRPRTRASARTDSQLGQALAHTDFAGGKSARSRRTRPRSPQAPPAGDGRFRLRRRA